MFGTLLIAVVDVPTPCASATTFCKGYTTGPWLLQLPLWMWAGCVLFGARPISEIFTVNAWLVGSQPMVAMPSGTCFRVALAAVAPVLVLADVGVEPGDEVAE